MIWPMKNSWPSGSDLEASGEHELAIAVGQGVLVDVEVRGIFVSGEAVFTREPATVAHEAEQGAGLELASEVVTEESGEIPHGDGLTAGGLDKGELGLVGLDLGFEGKALVSFGFQRSNELREVIWVCGGSFEGFGGEVCAVFADGGDDLRGDPLAERFCFGLVRAENDGI